MRRLLLAVLAATLLTAAGASAATTYSLTVSFDGTGSGYAEIVDVDNHSIDLGTCAMPGPCMIDVPTGHRYGVIGHPSDGSTIEYDGDCNTSRPYCVGDGQTGSAVTVTFTRPVYYTLTAAVDGSGSGTVESGTGSINCPTGSCSADYLAGHTVFLTATPAEGSRFAGWTNCDAPEDDTCDETMSADKTVTATFVAVHTLNVDSNPSDGGTVASDDTAISCPSTCSQTYDEGSQVTLTATPAEGYRFDGFVGCGGIRELRARTLAPDNQCTVTMANDEHVTADFVPIHTLTVQPLGAGSGTVTSQDGEIDCGVICSHDYDENTEVTLTANPESGSVFTGWSDCQDDSAAQCSVTMDAAKTVTATFVPLHTLTVANDPTDGGTVTSDDGGINCPGTCSAPYTEGSQVTLTATPAAGYRFVRFDGCEGSARALALRSQVIDECTVTMSDDENVTAVFVQQFQLQVNKDGSGSGTVTSSPEGIDCGATCSAVFDANSQVTLTATPDEGSTFTEWGGDCANADGDQCTVSMADAETVTATFTVVGTSTPTLTVAKEGSGTGTVTSDIGGISCGATCAWSYNANTVVTLTATADAGSRFVHFIGCDGALGSDFAPVSVVAVDECQVTVSEAKTVTASFVKQHTLHIETTGDGTVTTDDGLISCPGSCDATYDEGSQIKLDGASDSDQVNFGGDCTFVQDRSCSLELDADATVTVAFDDISTVYASTDGGGGGYVDDSAGDIDCGTPDVHSTCQHTYTFPHGSSNVVTLTAHPDAGSTFAGFDGVTCEETSGDTCSFDAQDLEVDVNASFGVTTPHELSVDKAGDGTGSVTSEPDGIDCGATCAADFDDDTDVTLTATADAGSSFAGWDGCDDSDGTTCEVHIEELGETHQVTATFTVAAAEPRTLTTTVTGNGTGYVDSDPAGIDCQRSQQFGGGGPHSACSSDYDGGTQVTLTAHPGPGSTFDGFTGCGRVETRTATALTCTVVIDGDTDVGASFSSTSGGGGGGGGGGGTIGTPTPTPAPTATATATPPPGGGGGPPKAKKPSFSLRSLHRKRLKLRLHCGTQRCVSIAISAGHFPSATTSLAAGDGQTVRLERRHKLHGHHTVHITVTFTLADGTTVVRHITLRL